MAITMELSGVRASDVSVQLSPVAELMAVLHVFAEPGHHPDRTSFVKHLGSVISDDLRRRLMELSPFWARFRSRHLMPLSGGPDGTLGDELATLSRLSVDAFTAMASEALLGVRSAEFRGLREDSTLAATFVERCAEKSDRRGFLAAQLSEDPNELQQRLVHTLEQCGHQFFDTEWARLRPRLTPAKRDIEEQLRHQSVPVVFASLTPTVKLYPAAARVVYDKLQTDTVRADSRTYVLVPSLFTQPHLLVKHDRAYTDDMADLPVVIQFPVMDMELSTGFTLEHLRQRLLVLTDPARLSLCRHLVNEECTTSELARRTGMPAPQVSRHLARLRDVGLLFSERDGRYIRHRLLLTRIYRLGPELVNSIVR
jgi:DNA-binding transcriptional ArsR family regulator